MGIGVGERGLAGPVGFLRPIGADVAAASDPDLAWAIKALRDPGRLARYRSARSFYDSGKPINGRLEQLGTEKFREVYGAVFDVADNLCAAVVDSVADRLKVEGVDPGVDGTEELAAEAWTIWQRNRMDVRAAETHLEALLAGDGYALVWPNTAGEAVIWSIPACDMVVSYDANVPGRLRRAARVWLDDETGLTHVDVFYVDRVERFVSRQARRTSALATSRVTWRDFEPWVEGDLESDGVLPNPHGRVPVVHFPNRRYHAPGVSELDVVIPLQRALNKTLVDLMVAQEFSAYRQRWATGIDVGDVDEETGKPVAPKFDLGVDRMVADPTEGAKFGSFEASDITQYVEVLENHRAEIARVSGTPLHYLFITRGDFPSGEAMKSAEARFTQKVERCQSHFGNQWEDLLALALQIEGSAEKVEGAQLSMRWSSASPLPSPVGAAGAQPGASPAPGLQ